MKKKTRQLLILNGLLILIVATAILSVNSGYAKIPFSTAVHSIFQPHMEGTSVVVAQFRVPRIVLAVLCGMGLALAGCVMQTVTGNPLADPGILGINAGAGFAVMLFLTFFPALHIRTMAYQPIFAIAGGLCTTGLLYLFAKRNGKLLPIYFLLGGIGLASLFSSFMLIMAANMDNSSYQLVARWLAGNIWGTSWHQVLALLPYMLILVPFLLTKSNILDILLLGENTAISLGIAVERELRLLLIASVALTSACVAVSGGIGFVGLVAPHMARRLIGGRHHALMPASMLLGALLLCAGCGKSGDIYTAGVYTASAEGYSGPVTVEVEFDGSSILSVHVLSHSETVNISDRAIDELPSRIVEAQTWDVDAVSSATLTSDAIREAVRDCLAQAALR